MKRNFIVIYFLIALLLFLTCAQESDIPGEYVPGEIIVGLVDSVSYTTVIDFFSSLNLEIIELYLDYPFKFVLVKTEIGKELYWINKLEQYDIVKYAELNYIGGVLDRS